MRRYPRELRQDATNGVGAAHRLSRARRGSRAVSRVAAFGVSAFEQTFRASGFAQAGPQSDLDLPPDLDHLVAGQARDSR